MEELVLFVSNMATATFQNCTDSISSVEIIQCSRLCWIIISANLFRLMRFVTASPELEGRVLGGSGIRKKNVNRFSSGECSSTNLWLELLVLINCYMVSNKVAKLMAL